MKPSAQIIAYVLEKAECEPAAKRAQLYRALSTLVVHDRAAEELVRMARGLEQIDLSHQQLVFDLKEKAT